MKEPGEKPIIFTPFVSLVYFCSVSFPVEIFQDDLYSTVPNIPRLLSLDKEMEKNFRYIFRYQLCWKVFNICITFTEWYIMEAATFPGKLPTCQPFNFDIFQWIICGKCFHHSITGFFGCKPNMSLQQETIIFVHRGLRYVYKPSSI